MKLFTKIASLLVITLLIFTVSSCKKDEPTPTPDPTPTDCTEHTYDNACDTDCNTCGATRETEHTYDNACDTDCNTCGAVRETEHIYDNACDTDCNTCGGVRETEHAYDGILDTDCNICGATREITLPAYDGTNTYTAINGNIPFFTPDEITKEGYEYYADLDALGRCGVAVGCLGPETLPTGSRGDIGSVSPTGWHSNPPIYARCHLIAWSLAGENANRQNLITGTTLLNNTMKEFEDMVCDHIKETGNHVMYRATPVFVGDNLLATGVLLEAYSVEDGGYGIEFCIFIHNVQTDYNIDYATGDATVSEDGMINKYKFVVGTGNYKIHLSTCRYVANIKESNRLYMNGTYQEVYNYCLSLGKSPTACGTCKPQNAPRQIYCIIPDKKLAPVVTATKHAA